MLRDQHTFEEAVQTLVTREVATPEECERAWVQLPRRPRRKRVDEESTAALPAISSASDSVDQEEARVAATAAVEALTRALNALPPTDRVLVQMHFWGGQTVARIALITGENQKGLYRRLDKVKQELRRRLEAEGLRPDMLAGFEGSLDQTAGPIQPPSNISGKLAEMGTVTTSPSTDTGTGGGHA